MKGGGGRGGGDGVCVEGLVTYTMNSTAANRRTNKERHRQEHEEDGIGRHTREKTSMMEGVLFFFFFVTHAICQACYR